MAPVPFFRVPPRAAPPCPCRWPLLPRPCAYKAAHGGYRRHPSLALCQDGVRINKAFTRTHSRREADALVAAGRVHVNGRKLGAQDSGLKLQRGDAVTLDGRRVAWENAQPSKGGAAASQSAGPNASKSFVYIAYNKPKGVVCTVEPSVAGNITSALAAAGVGRKAKGQRLFPVGRLDKPSTGLLIVTSDGRVPNAVLSPDAGYSKEYVVDTEPRVTDAHVAHLQDGVVITTTAQRKGAKPLTAPTKPCQVRRAGRAKLRITLTEGRNRQIRLMLDALGYRVLALHRVSFAGLSLGGLAPGAFRVLAGSELNVVHRWLDGG